jgi:preprotein translocase subunit SecB
MMLTAKAVNGEHTRFLVDLDYVVIFSIANVQPEHIHPMMFIECPRLILPFARRVVADATRDGGYPPLMLDNVDFAVLYRQKLDQLREEKRQKEQPN